MPRSLALLRRNAGIAVILPFAVLLAVGCDNGTDAGATGGAGSATGGSAIGGAGSGTGGNSSGGGGTGGGGSTDSGNDAAPRADAADDGPHGPIGPARIDLGTTTNLAAAGSYVLLAKTGITNVTGSAITGGHLGVSPAAATAIMGFGLIADSTNVFSTSPSVVPPAHVYASTYAPPTDSNLTTAVLNMEHAYTDGAARINPDFLNMGSGAIGGLTLTPGLYTWGTGVTIEDNVTISGSANGVWIFQIANDLDVSTAKSVILGGGADARNIFWVVAGQATIHANAHFEGVILAQTGITLQTMASMHGRALAQTLIALDNNAVTAP